MAYCSLLSGFRSLNLCRTSMMSQAKIISTNYREQLSAPHQRLQLTASLHTSSALSRIPGIRFPQPLSRQWTWEQAGINFNKYTHEAIPYVRSGGRGPDGRIQLKHVGGGLKRPFFMVDYNRYGDPKTGKPIVEEVLDVKDTWWRTAHIALVASGNHKRWIIATNRMKVGDIVRSHSEIPKIPVIPNEGDSHPLGALPIGTVVCCVETRLGQGADLARAAGTSAILTRKVNTETEGVVCYLRTSTKREMRVSQHCTAVVGQVSNSEHKFKRYKKFGEKRWHGIRQRSGLFQKKGGRFGRKIKPVKPPLNLLAPAPVKTVNVGLYTLEGRYDWTPPPPRIVHQYKCDDPDQVQPRFRWCSWSSVR